MDDIGVVMTPFGDVVPVIFRTYWQCAGIAEMFAGIAGIIAENSQILDNTPLGRLTTQYYP